MGITIRHLFNISSDDKEAVTRNIEHRKGGSVAILLRQDLAFTEIDDIQLIKTSDNGQLTVAIRTDSNRELYVSTEFCQIHNTALENEEGVILNWLWW